MHDLRSSILSGEDKSAKLVAPKAKTRKPEANKGSLTGLAIKREEARLTNHRREDRQRDIVSRAAVFFRRKKHDVRVVNVSSQGAMIKAPLEPRIGETVEIRFADCNRTKCIVRWVREDKIGLEFINETIILGTLKERAHIMGDAAVPELEESSYKPMFARARRHGLLWTGTLYWSYEAYSVRLRNISADGAMLEGDCNLEHGSKVRLNLAEAGTLEGEIRWSVGGQLGMKFDSKFDVKLLALNKPAAAPESDPMLKPDYLKSDGNASSPWAAMWERFSPKDLQRF